MQPEDNLAPETEVITCAMKKQPNATLALPPGAFTVWLVPGDPLDPEKPWLGSNEKFVTDAVLTAFQKGRKEAKLVREGGLICGCNW